LNVPPFFKCCMFSLCFLKHRRVATMLFVSRGNVLSFQLFMDGRVDSDVFVDKYLALALLIRYTGEVTFKSKDTAKSDRI